MAGICSAHGIFYILFHADPYHTWRTVRGVYRMRCDLCQVKKCETRDFLKKYNKLKLNQIIDKNCNQYEEVKR